MLAVHTPDALRQAVATEDLKALERVPGIGRKGASRIVLELGTGSGHPRGIPAGGATGAPVVAPTAVAEDVVVALQGLGWNAKVAGDAVASVLEAGDTPATDAGAILRAALRSLATDGH